MKCFLLTLFAGLCLCSPCYVQAQKFRLPDVPKTLTTPETRATYLSLHYWDYFDFADTVLVLHDDVTEQAFVDFLSILPYTTQAQAAVDTLFSCASTEEKVLRCFMNLSDKYLYERESPMCNEEQYILVLHALADNFHLKEVERERLRQLLHAVQKNRPGTVAADFALTCRDGKQLRFSDVKAELLLLFFNDPDCEDCHRVKTQLMSSSVINSLSDSGRLKIVSVCVEGKTEAWKNAIFPVSWIDGYDAGQRIIEEQVYDFKAMPTLYLLDADKRVLLKDVPVERIVAWLTSYL